MMIHPLPTDEATALLDRLEAHLTLVDRQRLATVVELLGPAGQVAVKPVLDRLYPGVSASSPTATCNDWPTTWVKRRPRPSWNWRCGSRGPSGPARSDD
jgi:hypothetical protein